METAHSAGFDLGIYIFAVQTQMARVKISNSNGPRYFLCNGLILINKLLSTNLCTVENRTSTFRNSTSIIEVFKVCKHIWKI